MSIDSNLAADQVEANDLDDFSASFFGPKEAVKEEPTEPVEDAEEDDAKEDALTEDDTLADDEEDAEEEVVEPQPKKNRTQERINELTRERHEAERKAAAKEAELAEAFRQIEELKKKTEAPTPPKEAVDTGPKASDLNEDGTDKYPLGEFDAAYIRDLMRHTLATERALLDEERKRAEQEATQKSLEEAARSNWDEKMAPAQERYPDFQEKSQSLLATFENIEPAYGEYLAATLMTMDYGPDVLYYLAENPEEADAIVKSGPTKATIALGRIESRFVASEETSTRPIKSSKAPPPPPMNKGSSAARSVSADTDDLEAFSSLLFSKKR